MVAALEKAREGEFREMNRVKASAEAEIFIITFDQAVENYDCDCAMQRSKIASDEDDST